MTEHESHLLGQWLKPGGNVPLGLAKRAWCVLQRDLPLEDLSACGLTEERILALFDNFDRMGMVGLGVTITTARQGVDWATLLKNMRRFGVWQGPGGLLESLQWQDREQWRQAVADALGRKQVPAAGHDQAAFACVAIRASRGVS